MRAGSELLLWGGDDGSGNNISFAGALYDPLRDKWRTMSTTPLRAAPKSAVWARDRVVFAGSEVAIYEPTKDLWSADPGGIQEKNAPLLAYTGDEVVGWFFEVGATGSGLRSMRSTQRSPTTSRPRQCRSATTPHRRGTGREAMIFPSTGRSGIAYDPGTNRWRTLPKRPPVEFVSKGLVTWTGTDVIAYGVTPAQPGLLTGAADQPVTNSWKLLPAIPVPQNLLKRSTSFIEGPRLVWTDNHVLLLTGALTPTLRCSSSIPIDTRRSRTNACHHLPSNRLR